MMTATAAPCKPFPICAHVGADAEIIPFLPKSFRRHAGGALPWWMGHRADLETAISIATEAAPHLAALANFLLPRLPRGVAASSTIKGAGGDKRASCSTLALRAAVRHQWISFNGNTATNTITADLDLPGWQPRLRELIARGLPPPAFTVASPWKGTAHLVWVMDRPFDNQNPAHVRLYKGIRKGLSLAFADFGCDGHFANRLQKNPWHRRADGCLATPDPEIPCGDPELWEAYLRTGQPTTYYTEIGTLATISASDLLTPLLALFAELRPGAYLLAPRPIRLACGDDKSVTVSIPGVPDTRNALFRAAADAVRRACTADPTKILTILRRTASAFHREISPSSQTEMVESIGAWMRTKWKGPLDGRGGVTTGRKPVDAGVMRGEAADAGPDALAAWDDLDLAERRQAAGQRSARHVSDKADHGIQDAFLAVIHEGGRLTLDTIAAKAGLSLRTVKARSRTLSVDLEKVQPGLIWGCGGAPLPSSFFPSLSGNLPLSEAIRLVRKALKESEIQAQKAELRDQADIAVYEAIAARLRKPGTEPQHEPITPPRPDASPALTSAYQAACLARADAARRAEGRRRAVLAKIRAAQREQWHQEHAHDEAAWKARLEEITSAEIVAVQDELRRGGEDDRLDRIELMYRSIRSAENRARRRALGLPVKKWHRQRAAEAENEQIPW